MAASYLVLLLSSCLLGYENGQFTLHNVVSYALGDHRLLTYYSLYSWHTVTTNEQEGFLWGPGRYSMQVTRPCGWRTRVRTSGTSCGTSGRAYIIYIYIMDASCRPDDSGSVYASFLSGRSVMHGRWLWQWQRKRPSLFHREIRIKRRAGGPRRRRRTGRGCSASYP
jgi:hypothetical protein